jgi:hypothetical protein
VSCVVDFLAGARPESDFVFGSFFFWLPGKWDNFCLAACIIFMIHGIEGFVLPSPATSSPASVASSLVVKIFPGVEGSLPVIRLWRPKIFLLIFRRPATIKIDAIDMFGCVVKVSCVLPASVVSG